MGSGTLVALHSSWRSCIVLMGFEWYSIESCLGATSSQSRPTTDHSPSSPTFNGPTRHYSGFPYARNACHKLVLWQSYSLLRPSIMPLHLRRCKIYTLHSFRDGIACLVRYLAPKKAHTRLDRLGCLEMMWALILAGISPSGRQPALH